MSRLRPLLWPAAATAVMLAVLIALGFWQLHRLAWKEDLLGDIARAESAPAVPLPADPKPFTKVSVSGTLRHDAAALYGAEVRDTPSGPQMGAQLIVPLIRPSGPPILIDRGWVPTGPHGPIDQPAGPVEIDGYVRARDAGGWFDAADDVAGRRFYVLAPTIIGPALGVPDAAPFTLIAMGAPQPGSLPDPARTLPRPPNNHLSYAFTWFGLAASLVAVFSVYARKVIRR